MKLAKFSQRFCSTKKAVEIKSSLVITGAKAEVVSRTIIPDIDTQNFVQNAEKWEKNLKRRSLVDKDLFGGLSLSDLVKKTDEYDKLLQEIKSSEQERTKIQEKLKNDPKDDGAKSGQKTIKNRIKALQKSLNVAEEDCIVPLLKLPNSLDVKTPDKDKVIKQICPNEGLLKNKKYHDADLEFEEGNSSNVFLKGDLALQEIELLSKAQTFLQEDEFCDTYSAPDIVRSVVMEGCDPLSFGDPKRSLVLAKSSDFGKYDSGLGAHLVGAASFPAMVSFFVKHIIANSDVLPLNWMSIGKQYFACEEPQYLYNTQQSSCVGLISLNTDHSSATEESFKQFESKYQAFYDDLGLDYRLVYKGASKLNLPESLRLEVQVWSPRTKEFITVGSLSKYEDYVSRRLLLKYLDKNKALRNLQLLGGTFIDTYKVLGCLIDNKSL